MPIPAALVPSLISAGGSFFGGVANAVSQAGQNIRSQRFQREMYQRQYDDAVKFWNLQNAYNSPEQQMQRFKDAGLNPHLIYGQGNAGNAGPIPVPDAKMPEFRSPQWGNAITGAGDAISQLSLIYDLDIKRAQADNLRAQNQVIQEDALYRKAQRDFTVAGTERSRFDLGLDTELRQVSADARRESLRQIRTNIDLSMREDARRALQNASNLQEAVERMKNMQEQRATMAIQRAQTREEIQRIRQDTNRIIQSIELLKKDNVVRALDADLSRMNVRPGDPLWYRTAGILVDAIFKLFD